MCNTQQTPYPDPHPRVMYYLNDHYIIILIINKLNNILNNTTECAMDCGPYKVKKSQTLTGKVR